MILLIFGIHIFLCVEGLIHKEKNDMELKQEMWLIFLKQGAVLSGTALVNLAQPGPSALMTEQSKYWYG